MSEDRIEIESKGKVGDWSLGMSVSPGAGLPFTAITEDAVAASFQGMDYRISVPCGHVEDLRSAESPGAVFRISPENGKIVMLPR